MTENSKGKVVSVNGNLLAVEFDGDVSMNEICYVRVGGAALKSEVIRIRGTTAQVQVYEMTDGIQCGDEVEFTGEMLSALLGPGLLGQIYDGCKTRCPPWPKRPAGFWSAACTPARWTPKKNGNSPPPPSPARCCTRRGHRQRAGGRFYPQDIRPLFPAGQLHAEIYCTEGRIHH